jgi:Ca2+-binding EF-hand superfamily protein
MMRILAALLVFFSLTVLVVAQEEGQRQRNRNGGPTGGPPGGGQPPWMQGQGGRGGPPGGGQPPWMQGQGGGRGNPQSQNAPNRNEQMFGMLKAMDTNQNGLLEPNEIPEYRRGFVIGVVTQMGGNPNGTINLNVLANDLAKRTNSSSRGQSGSTASGQAVPPQNDPLVPPFGEKTETTTSVLTFGQKESIPAATVAVKQAERTSSGQSLRSAQEMMAKFDKNKNGMIDKDKGEWVGLPFSTDAADKNRDGRISMAELIAVLGGQSSSSTGNAVVAVKQSLAYDRLPPGVPDWFLNMDKDQDAQITMTEYVNGRGGTWTKEIAKEFRFLDKNNDGAATIAEVFVVLKEEDEQRALEAEKQKRESERRKGVVAAAVPLPSGQPIPAEQANQQPPSSVPQPTPPQPGKTATPPNSMPAAAPSAAPYASGSNNSDRRDTQRRSTMYNRGNR